MTTIRAGNIVGGSVIINGKRVVSDGSGVVIIGGTLEDTPKVHEEYDDVTNVSLSDCEDVNFSVGSRFIADGMGFCKKNGGRVTLQSFSGDVTVPDLDSIDAELNSGRFTGQISSMTLDVKVNSGAMNLKLQSKSKSPTINAKVNSGNINITVV